MCHDWAHRLTTGPQSGSGTRPAWQLPPLPRRAKTERLELIGLPGQQLPPADLLLPNHQDADLDRVGLAFTFGFASQKMTYDRALANDLVALTRQGHELPNRSSAHGAVDKLGFGL